MATYTLTLQTTFNSVNITDPLWPVQPAVQAVVNKSDGTMAQGAVSLTIGGVVVGTGSLPPGSNFVSIQLSGIQPGSFTLSGTYTGTGSVDAGQTASATLALILSGIVSTMAALSNQNATAGATITVPVSVNASLVPATGNSLKQLFGDTPATQAAVNYTYVGQSQNTLVLADQADNPTATDVGSYVLSVADANIATLRSFFESNLPPLSRLPAPGQTVAVICNNFGPTLNANAFHYTCLDCCCYIKVGPVFGGADPDLRIGGWLFMAEASETLQALQGGSLVTCDGQCMGEALSIMHAELIYPGILNFTPFQYLQPINRSNTLTTSLNVATTSSALLNEDNCCQRGTLTLGGSWFGSIVLEYAIFGGPFQTFQVQNSFGAVQTSTFNGPGTWTFFLPGDVNQFRVRVQSTGSGNASVSLITSCDSVSQAASDSHQGDNLGMVKTFFYWMIENPRGTLPQKYTIQQITSACANALNNTPAMIYQSLTGDAAANALTKFRADIDFLFPPNNFTPPAQADPWGPTPNPGPSPPPPAHSTVPPGTVTLTVGTLAPVTQTLNAGLTTFSNVSTSGLSPGTYTIKATYNGNAFTTPVTQTATLTITGNIATVVIQPGILPTYPDQPTPFVSAVDASGKSVAGTIALSVDGGTPLTGTTDGVTSSGVSFKLSGILPGTHTLSATFTGSPPNAGMTGTATPVSLSVAGVNTTIAPIGTIPVTSPATANVPVSVSGNFFGTSLYDLSNFGTSPRPLTFIGQVGNVCMLLDTALTQGGLTGAGCAASCLSRLAADVAALQAYFGPNVIFPPTVFIIATNQNITAGPNMGHGGAYNFGSTNPVCVVDAALQDPRITSSLFLNEFSEIGQDVQGLGWSPPFSHGEALSQVHGQSIYPGVQEQIGYLEFSNFLNASPRPDWITAPEQTDRDAVATGCGKGFIYWLRDFRAARTFGIAQITQAGGNSFADVYKNLVGGAAGGTGFGDPTAWNAYSADVTNKFPPGGGQTPPANSAPGLAQISVTLGDNNAPNATNQMLSSGQAMTINYNISQAKSAQLVTPSGAITIAVNQTTNSASGTLTYVPMTPGISNATNGTNFTPDPGNVSCVLFLQATDVNGLPTSFRFNAIVQDSPALPALDFTINPTTTSAAPVDGVSNTFVSVKSGSWTDPTVWGNPTGGALPTRDSITVINVGHAVTATGRNCQTGRLIVKGTFTFTNGALYVTDLDGQTGSTINIGDGQSTSLIILRNRPQHAKDTTLFWPAVNVNGCTLNLNGAPVTPYARATGDILAGATSIPLDRAVSNWQTGNKLYVPDTRQVNDPATGGDLGSQFEIAEVRGISADGKTLYLVQPLAYSHLGNRDGLGVLSYTAHIFHLIRSAGFITADATRIPTRAHCYATGHAAINCAYGLWHGLGRTTGQPLSATNVADRYSLYLDHVVGPVSPVGLPTPWSSYQFRLDSCVFLDPWPVVDTPQALWGCNISDSHYGYINECISFNWYGAGWFVEKGNETGNLFQGNVACRIVGNGRRAGDVPLGTNGGGFWLRSPLSSYINNIATNCYALSGGANFAYGLTYYAGLTGALPIPNSQGSDTNVAGQYTIRDVNFLPLTNFSGNECYANTNGITWWFVGFSQQTDITASQAPSTILKCVVWHCPLLGVFPYPVNQVLVDGLVIRGDFSKLNPFNGYPIAINPSDYPQCNSVYQHLDIQGCYTGWLPSPNGAQFAAGGISPNQGTQTLKNSLVRCFIGVQVQTLNSSGAFGNAIPAPRIVIVDNVQFDFTGIPSNMGTPLTILMDYHANTLLQSENLTNLDEMFVYNYQKQPGNNFRVYYNQQVANFVPPVTTFVNGVINDVGQNPSPGNLTNAQLVAAGQPPLAGAVAPSYATTLPNIGGLVSTNPNDFPPAP